MFVIDDESDIYSVVGCYVSRLVLLLTDYTNRYITLLSRDYSMRHSRRPKSILFTIRIRDNIDRSIVPVILTAFGLLSDIAKKHSASLNK